MQSSHLNNIYIYIYIVGDVTVVESKQYCNTLQSGTAPVHYIITACFLFGNDNYDKMTMTTMQAIKPIIVTITMTMRTATNASFKCLLKRNARTSQNVDNPSVINK